MSREVIELAVTSYYANLAALNREGWLETLAADAVICDPVGKPPLNAKEDSQKFFELLSLIYETFEIFLDQIFISGQGAAVKWTMKITAKNRQTATVEGIGVFSCNEAGKIEQMQSYWDEAGMKAQLRGE